MHPSKPQKESADSEATRLWEPEGCVVFHTKPLPVTEGRIQKGWMQGRRGGVETEALRVSSRKVSRL